MRTVEINRQAGQVRQEGINVLRHSLGALGGLAVDLLRMNRTWVAAAPGTVITSERVIIHR